MEPKLNDDPKEGKEIQVNYRICISKNRSFDSCIFFLLL